MEVSKQVDNVVHSVTILPDVASFETRRTVNVSGPTTQVDAVGAAFYVTVIKQGIGDAFDPRRVILNVPINAALPPGFLPKQAVIRSAIIGWRVSFPTEWLFAPFSLDWGMVASARGEFGPDRTGEAMLSYLRNVLTDNISDHDLPLNSFAAICGLHPRRLQRNLCARGTSYNQLKDEVRQSITEDLLSNTTLPIAEIALKVGLSGPAALHRAFRRWTGKTPNSFRSEAAQDQLGRGADERCEFNAGRKLERRA
jgi:AraC-like DNA-binding protein